MSVTTAETRRQSFEAILPKIGTRKDLILRYLSDGKVATAREIATALGFAERNATQPRLNELVADGLVLEAGTKWDESTKRNVSAYKSAHPDPICGSCPFWRCFESDKDKSSTMQVGGCLKGQGRRYRYEKQCEKMKGDR